MQATIKQLQTARIRPLSAIRGHNLWVPTAEGIHIMPIDEIVHCKADSNYCHIRTIDQKDIFVSKPVKYIEDQLPNSMFVRVHQSHLVNTAHIRFIGRDSLRLVDGTEIPISRRKRQFLLDFIQPSAV